MISVVIPLYNKENQIRATLESVLAQTFSDFEIVIVNDGSSDRSVEEASAVNDPRIRLIHQPNAGVSAARNRGIEKAKGEFIAFLDADDRWKPEYLQTQYELTHHYPECSVFACNYEFVDAQGQVRPTIIRKLPFPGEHGILGNYFKVASCSHPPICSISIMVRKTAIQSIGGFPLHITHGEDLLTWAKLACQYKIAYSRKSLALYMLKPNHGANGKPVNIPQSNIVGKELEHLSRKYQGLKKYVSHWYRIRANIFLRGGDNRNAVWYICRSLIYNPFNAKSFIFAFILLVPCRFRNSIFRLFSK